MSFCLTFENVTKSYGSDVILEDFSLEIEAQITTALVGESGSGKSTLLMLANGLILPDRGTVHVMGQPLASQDLISLRRQTGYAVQGAGLFPHLTVAENVSLVATLEGVDEAAASRRLAQLFELLNLDLELVDRYPHSLSGGQQQRVSLCRAMMLNPPLLLLDEPFSALDPLTRGDIHEEFARLQSFEPRSILLVTHDMSEAVKLAQQVVVLRDGRVVQSGDVASVIENPADDYVRRLLGERP